MRLKRRRDSALGPLIRPGHEPEPVDLPPYSGEEPLCSKCNEFGASTTYMQGGTCHHWGSENVVIGLQANERLHRSCKNCGYQWDEATREHSS